MSTRSNRSGCSTRWACVQETSQYAAAFALVFVDRAGIDVTGRRVWADREAVFGRLRDQGLRIWYRLKTGGRQ